LCLSKYSPFAINLHPLTMCSIVSPSLLHFLHSSLTSAFLITCCCCCYYNNNISTLLQYFTM
jgi:hypothetical protein